MNKIPPNSLDWTYIETTHNYDTTTTDLKIADRLVRSPEFRGGHDSYNRPSYSAFAYGVFPAVCAFCLERTWVLAFLTLRPNGHLSFRLKRDDSTASAEER